MRDGVESMNGRDPQASGSRATRPLQRLPTSPPQATVNAAASNGAAGSLAKGLVFNVRFTDGKTEDVIALWVGDKDPVRDVKRRIRLLRTDTLAGRRLRLIYLGRILTDGVLLVPWTASLLERQKQYEAGQTGLLDDALEGLEGVVKSVAGDDPGNQDGKGKGKAFIKGDAGVLERPIWLNCSVGDIEEPEQPIPDTEPMQAPQMTPLQGFDRLREAGFSDEDINSIRSQFHESDAAEGDSEHARALEDQWMEGANQSDPNVDTTSGHYMTLLQGSMIGFAFPLLPFFFFRTPLFSRRFQMAIVLGLVINLAFSVLQFFS